MAKPWLPRMHLFEIDDQPWFPPFLRAYVQAGLTHAWTVCLPVLQKSSPATLVANTLCRVLGTSVLSHTYIDFCAGAGGPTPFIERALNAQLGSSTLSMTHSVPTPNKESSELLDKPLPSYEAAVTSTKMSKKKWKQQQRKQKELLKQQELQEQQKQQQQQEQQEATTTSTVVSSGDNGRVRFVLTDLHPHVEAWETAAGQSPYLTYVREPVDAASAPAKLLGQQVVDGKGVFRLFNLAFHHFDDRLARAILRNTVETSDGFGIFELQDRTLSGFLTCGLFGFFIMLVAPFLYWWSLERLFFVYVLPVVPFVLVFDGVVSCLRTRSVDEVDTLLRTCGTNTDGWEIQSGRERHLWPCGYLNWIICTKKKHE